MPKIVRVFAVTEPTLHQQALDEANFLANAAKAAGQAVKKVVNKAATKVASKTAPEADPNAAPEENAPSADDTMKSAQPLDTIVSALTNTPTGVTRFAIHMSHEDFAAYFMKSDPNSRAQLAANLMTKGQHGAVPVAAAQPKTESALSLLQIVEALPPINGGKASDRVAAIKAKGAANAAAAEKTAQPATPAEKPAEAPPAITPSIGMLSNGFKFSSLLKTSGDNDYTVLMNIPTGISSAYQAALKSGNRAEIGKVLSQVLNHKYYVMTLNNPMAKKIASQMDGAHNLEEKKAAFNPNCIVNHPSKQLLAMAKNEWNEEHAANHAAANAPAKEEPKPEVDSVKSGETAMAQTKPDAAQAAPSGEQPAAQGATKAETPPAEEETFTPNVTAEKLQDLWNKFLKHNGGINTAKPNPAMISLAKSILSAEKNQGTAE